MQRLTIPYFPNSKAAIQLKFGRKTSRLTCGVYIIKAITLSKANLTP